MTTQDLLTGVLVDEVTLSLDELAHACGVSADWVQLHVEAGVFALSGDDPLGWRFSSRDLWRARQLCSLERNFDALPELAALVIDLQEEIARLRRRLEQTGWAM